MNARTSPYVITVAFEIEPESEADFMELMVENARESLRSEPGCLHFDVLTPLGGQQSGRVFLYEIYVDRAAFDEHLASSHFKEFDVRTNAMVRSKKVAEYAMIGNAKAGC